MLQWFTQGSTIRKRILILLLGQSLSIYNASSQVFNAYIGSAGIHIPTLQLVFVYFLLSLLLPIKFIKYGKEKKDWWVYGIIMILAFIDIEANYCVIKAFQYSYFVTIGLLLNLTVPISSFLSYLILRRKYSMSHLIGGIITISGLLLIFYESYHSEISKDMNSKTGNLLVLLATVLYSISNITFEYMLKSIKFDKGNLEFLGFLGIFGTMIGTIQTIILEKEDIQSVEWTFANTGYIIGFAIVIFLFYYSTSVFLMVSESILLNLSLVTADIFNVFFSYFLFDVDLPWFYWVGLILNIVGIGIYSIESVNDIYTKEQLIKYRTSTDMEDDGSIRLPDLDIKSQRSTAYNRYDTFKM